MGLDRRGFIQFLVGGAVGTLFTPIPWKLTDDISIWTQNWPWIPRNLKGASTYEKTVSKLCPTNCGISVRKVAGFPIRAIGDADSPLSGGKLSSMAAAEVQLLYSPARLKRPMVKGPDGGFSAVTWDVALNLIEEKLSSIKGVKDKLAVVSGDQNGSVNEVLSGFCKLAGSSNFFIMPSESQNAMRTWKTVMGNQGQPGYDLENSDYVLAIGADILESWGPAIHNRRAYSAKRPHGQTPEAKYVYAGPVQNNTATGADEWKPIKPGTEGVLAAALVNLLIAAGKSIESPEFGDLQAAVKGFDADTAAKITGLAAGQIKALADELSKASSPCVIVDSSFNQGAGAAPMILTTALNLLASGGIDQPGGMTVIPEMTNVVDAAMNIEERYAKDLVSFLADGGSKPEMIVFYEANPAYALPQAKTMTQAMAEIPFKVSFTSFLDETAMACDVVLPTPMGLERYDDVVTPYGLSKAMYFGVYPVAPQLVPGPAAPDVILALGKNLGMDMGYDNFKSVLDAKAASIDASFDDLQGGYEEAPGLLGIGMPKLNAAVLSKALAAAPQGAAEISLAPVDKLNFGTSTTSTPPFNLKTVRDTVLLGDLSFIHLNGATASKVGVTEGDLVNVSSDAGEVKALVHIDEGIMQDVVAAPLGFGHTAFDDFTRGKGSNTAQLMKVAVEPGSNFSTWDATAVKIAKI